MKGGQEKMRIAPRNKQAGFTLLETMVALLIFLVLFLGAAVAIITSMYLGSVIKHKVQAMYWAQRFIEEERRLPFSTLASLPSASVSLDTNGTFDTTADDRTGNRVVTVTNIDTYRKRLKIEINWTEKFLRGTNTMREYYSTDIAQESQLN
jgi:prepilin-type N-terminal cleavage/methylation domain-containing protein